ncbi:hypothetical protein NIIDNTM18_14930 [Mycolicibacterium litorale]|uniref:Uncharacterized protein n=1 Tax=Mycolicibacterium litorale TaxID=758802 RepID=A0A6S6P1D0_9MYCO|nr:hypothetical protein NIIDNTM18_14930 [Mycolicibacterium litorale]
MQDWTFNGHVGRSSGGYAGGAGHSGLVPCGDAASQVNLQKNSHHSSGNGDWRPQNLTRDIA